MKNDVLISYLKERINGVENLRKEDEAKDTSFYVGYIFAYKELLKDVRNDKFYKKSKK